MNTTTVCPIILANDLMQINVRAEGAHLLPRRPRTAPCIWPPEATQCVGHINNAPSLRPLHSINSNVA